MNSCDDSNEMKSTPIHEDDNRLYTSIVQYIDQFSTNTLRIFAIILNSIEFKFKKAQQVEPHASSFVRSLRWFKVNRLSRSYNTDARYLDLMYNMFEVHITIADIEDIQIILNKLSELYHMKKIKTNLHEARYEIKAKEDSLIHRNLKNISFILQIETAFALKIRGYDRDRNWTTSQQEEVTETADLYITHMRLLMQSKVITKFPDFSEFAREALIAHVYRPNTLYYKYLVRCVESDSYFI